MDLNILVDIPAQQNISIKDIIERAFEFGYECIALNTVVESENLSGKNISIPEPKSINFTLPPTRKFKILNRITAIVEDSIHSHHFLKSPVTKKYDLIAVQPIGEKMLQHVCSSLDVDIISLNMTESLAYTLKKTSVGLAISKGACFEISYAPCLRDVTSKRMTISNGQVLVGVAKGKNIIVSSGARKPLEIRSAEDVINLGLLFGFEKNQSEASVRKTGQHVVSHAATRNSTGCGFVSLTGILRLPKHQGWIVQACKVPKMADFASSSTKKRAIDDVSDVKNTKMIKKRKGNKSKKNGGSNVLLPSV